LLLERINIPLPINLLEAFAKGYIETKEIVVSATTAEVHPERHKCWLILGGCLSHSAGATDLVQVMRKIEYDAGSTVYLWQIQKCTTAAGVAASLFNGAASEDNGQWSPFIITDEMVVALTSDGIAVLRFQVLEWTP
jgi:hypothetical protein